MADERVFKNQTLFDLILNTGENITAADPVKIKYKKPESGNTGEWTGEIYDTTKIKYSCGEDDIDESGHWIFWSYVTIEGRDAPGKPVSIEIFVEGKIN